MDTIEAAPVLHPASHAELLRILERQAADQTPAVFAASWDEFARIFGIDR